MKRSLFLSITLFCTIPLWSQSSKIPFYDRTDFQFAAPGATQYGLYGLDNPAALSYQQGVDLSLYFSDRAKKSLTDHWGAFFSSSGTSFGMLQERTAVGSANRYNVAAATGDRQFSLGAAYNWTKTDNAFFDRSDYLTLGALLRPHRMVSFGAAYEQVTNGKGWNGSADLSVRPFGTEVLTLFGEYALQRMPLLKNEVWSAGAVVEPVPGARIVGRLFSNSAVNIGLQLNLGHIGLSSQSHFDNTTKYAYNTYGFRIGMYEGNILRLHTPAHSKYVSPDLSGTIGYQRFELFDDTRTLSSILMSLDAVKNDPTVAGIAINATMISSNRELLWEVREKLKECKAAGKRIIVFIDRGGLDLYHFVSVADRIVMDPQGSLTLDGYVMGRTYLKGLLEKLGVGFDEWRFFKYKSANESYSLDKMSDADREQRQALVDAWLAIAKKEIGESRNISSSRFDSLLSSVVMFSAEEARSAGLVDSIGRWETVKEMVKSETGSANGWASMATVQKNAIYPVLMQWGELPKIAVIYAIGACAMDDGIRARTLVRDVEAAVNNSDIKAIVLRVDSPGGDAMASDYITEALKKAKGKKPVIVSQGFVAASGGYWLSMDADTIVAAPGTITGSIGVIGGWLYNKGLKESIGLSTDLVKAGAHADLGFGFQLPLLGLGIPDRNLNLEERSKAETMIRAMYGDFVHKVAAGRGMTDDAVGAIAQGRVWSGIDGKKNGLVDELGGLETAVKIAITRAGLSPDDHVAIVEMPKKGLFDLGSFVPRLIGMESPAAADPTLEMLKFRLQHNGDPLPIVPLDDVELWNSGTKKN